MQRNMGRILAVVLSATFPRIFVRIIGYSCGIVPTVVKTFVLFAIELLSMYVYYASVSYGYIGCLVGAFSCSVLIYPCGNPGMTDADYDQASFEKMGHVVTGVLIMTVVDVCFGQERASTSAIKHLLQTMLKLDAWLQAIFIQRKPNGDANPRFVDEFKYRDDIAILKTMKKAARQAIKHFNPKKQGDDIRNCIHLSANLSLEADLEPRYERRPWQKDFFNLQVKHCSSLRHRLQVIENVMMGMSNQADGYSSFQKLHEYAAWKRVKEELVRASGHAVKMTQMVLRNETGKQSLMAQCANSLEETNKIEGMDDLFKEINALGGYRYPSNSQVHSMESDDICRLNVMLLHLEEIMEVLAKMEKNCLRHP